MAQRKKMSQEEITARRRALEIDLQKKEERVKELQTIVEAQNKIVQSAGVGTDAGYLAQKSMENAISKLTRATKDRDRTTKDLEALKAQETNKSTEAKLMRSNADDKSKNPGTAAGAGPGAAAGAGAGPAETTMTPDEDSTTNQYSDLDPDQVNEPDDTDIVEASEPETTLDDAEVVAGAGAGAGAETAEQASFAADQESVAAEAASAAEENEAAEDAAVEAGADENLAAAGGAGPAASAEDANSPDPDSNQDNDYNNTDPKLANAEVAGAGAGPEATEEVKPNEVNADDEPAEDVGPEAAETVANAAGTEAKHTAASPHPLIDEDTDEPAAAEGAGARTEADAENKAEATASDAGAGDAEPVVDAVGAEAVAGSVDLDEDSDNPPPLPHFPGEEAPASAHDAGLGNKEKLTNFLISQLPEQINEAEAEYSINNAKRAIELLVGNLFTAIEEKTGVEKTTLDNLDELVFKSLLYNDDEQRGNIQQALAIPEEETITIDIIQELLNNFFENMNNIINDTKRYEISAEADEEEVEVLEAPDPAAAPGPVDAARADDAAVADADLAAAAGGVAGAEVKRPADEDAEEEPELDLSHLELNDDVANVASATPPDPADIPLPGFVRNPDPLAGSVELDPDAALRAEVKGPAAPLRPAIDEDAEEPVAAAEAGDAAGADADLAAGADDAAVEEEDIAAPDPAAAAPDPADAARAEAARRAADAAAAEAKKAADDAAAAEDARRAAEAKRQADAKVAADAIAAEAKAKADAMTALQTILQTRITKAITDKLPTADEAKALGLDVAALKTQAENKINALISGELNDNKYRHLTSAQTQEVVRQLDTYAYPKAHEIKANAPLNTRPGGVADLNFSLDLLNTQIKPIESQLLKTAGIAKLNNTLLEEIKKDDAPFTVTSGAPAGYDIGFDEKTTLNELKTFADTSIAHFINEITNGRPPLTAEQLNYVITKVTSSPFPPNFTRTADITADEAKLLNANLGDRFKTKVKEFEDKAAAAKTNFEAKAPTAFKSYLANQITRAQGKVAQEEKGGNTEYKDIYTPEIARLITEWGSNEPASNLTPYQMDSFIKAGKPTQTPGVFDDKSNPTLNAVQDSLDKLNTKVQEQIQASEKARDAAKIKAEENANIEFKAALTTLRSKIYHQNERKDLPDYKIPIEVSDFSNELKRAETDFAAQSLRDKQIILKAIKDHPFQSGYNPAERKFTAPALIASPSPLVNNLYKKATALEEVVFTKFKSAVETQQQANKLVWDQINRFMPNIIPTGSPTLKTYGYDEAKYQPTATATLNSLFTTDPFQGLNIAQRAEIKDQLAKQTKLPFDQPIELKTIPDGAEKDSVIAQLKTIGNKLASVQNEATKARAEAQLVSEVVTELKLDPAKPTDNTRITEIIIDLKENLLKSGKNKNELATLFKSLLDGKETNPVNIETTLKANGIESSDATRIKIAHHNKLIAAPNFDDLGKYMSSASYLLKRTKEEKTTAAIKLSEPIYKAAEQDATKRAHLSKNLPKIDSNLDALHSRIVELEASRVELKKFHDIYKSVGLEVKDAKDPHRSLRHPLTRVPRELVDKTKLDLLRRDHGMGDQHIDAVAKTLLDEPNIFEVHKQLDEKINKLQEARDLLIKQKAILIEDPTKQAEFKASPAYQANLACGYEEPDNFLTSDKIKRQDVYLRKTIQSTESDFKTKCDAARAEVLSSISATPATGLLAIGSSAHTGVIRDNVRFESMPTGDINTKSSSAVEISHEVKNDRVELHVIGVSKNLEQVNQLLQASSKLNNRHYLLPEGFNLADPAATDAAYKKVFERLLEQHPNPTQKDIEKFLKQEKEHNRNNLGRINTPSNFAEIIYKAYSEQRILAAKDWIEKYRNEDIGKKEAMLITGDYAYHAACYCQAMQRIAKVRGQSDADIRYDYHSKANPSEADVRSTIEFLIKNDPTLSKELNYSSVRDSISLKRGEKTEATKIEAPDEHLGDKFKSRTEKSRGMRNG